MSVLLSDLDEESLKPGPTMSITKAQYAYLRARIRSAEHRADDAEHNMLLLAAEVERLAAAIDPERQIEAVIKVIVSYGRHDNVTDRRLLAEAIVAHLARLVEG